MNQTLQEFVDSRGVQMRVDREKGVIRGVKILGLESRNGRTYLPEALARAVELYEGAKVNVNHPKGNPTGVRDYQDRIGVIRNVAVRGAEGLFADFHFNPKHALAEQLAWDAQHTPENVGFSHNVHARTTRHGDRVVVEAITKVQSVDLVSDPATTRGLFESAAGAAEADGPPAVPEMTVEYLRQHRPELVEAIRSQQAEELEKLRGEVDRLRAAETLQQRRAAVRRLLREFNLPDPETAEGPARSIVSDHFVESLLAAADEGAMRELIEERAELVRSLADRGGGQTVDWKRPLSRDQNQLHGAPQLDARTFAEAIT